VNVPQVGDVEIRPTGLFAQHITAALSALMVATSLEPLDALITAIGEANPGLEDEKVEELAIAHRADTLSSAGSAEVARIMGEENLMYQLASDAIHQELDWCIDWLGPQLASSIVKQAMEVGGVREYLGECLTLLYTATPAMEEPQTPPTTDDESPEDSSEPPADSGISEEPTSSLGTVET